MRTLRADSGGSPRSLPPLLGPELLVVIFITIALVGSLAAAVIPMEQAAITVDEQGRMMMNAVKTPLYYAAQGAAVISVIAAGLMGALMGGFKILGTGVRLAFLVLTATSAIWAAKAYTAREIFSPAIIGATGPFVWLSLIFVMAGTERRIWHYIERLIPLLAYASSALAIRTLLSAKYASYAGFSRYTLYAGLLTWLGGWTLLSGIRLNGLRLLVRFVPNVMLMLMAICSQSRSWTILGCLLALSFVVLRSIERGSATDGLRTLIVGCILCASVALLLYAVIPATIVDSVQGLSARLDQDSRSDQYTQFFSVVPVSDLVFGKGPKGTWYWRGFGEYQYFDNGYLWTLFVGGFPTLICYVTIMLWPALRAVREFPQRGDAVAVCLGLLWGLALTGLSTFCLPSLTISNYFLALTAGRCHLLLAERRAQKRVQSRCRLSSPPRGTITPSNRWPKSFLNHDYGQIHM